MEPKFINESLVTLERYLYWAKNPVGKKAVQNRKAGIRLRIALICCGPVFILSSILTQEFSMLFMGIFVIFLGIAKLFFLPNIVLKKQYDMILKSQNADKWLEKFTFSEEIICESGKANVRYAYSDIVNVKEDSEYFYLFYNEDMVLRIYKQGFVLGNAEDFRNFCQDFLENSKAEK